MTATIHHADAVQWAREYQGDLFHAALCDPPYSLQFMGKKWDGDIAFRPDTWAAFANVLHDGAFIFAFASSRGWHRQAVAMEDAGLVIHPSIFGFCFGSGFPKATRIDTQIDKRGGASVGWFGAWLREYRETHGVAQKELAKHFPSKTGGLTGCVANWELGFNLPTVEQFNKLVEVLNLPFATIDEAEREVIGKATGAQSDSTGKYGGWGNDDGSGNSAYDITAPATPLAQAWAGHRYGLQAMKPALEPIIVAQKPYKGKPVECITRTGAGAINVDGGRIPLTQYDVEEYIPNRCGWKDGIDYKQPHAEEHNTSTNSFGVQGAAPVQVIKANGRWPANFFVDSAGAQRLDELSGELKPATSRTNGNGKTTGNFIASDSTYAGTVYQDANVGASRFFFQAVADQIDDADAVNYCAKASRRERDDGLEGRRNVHPTVKALSLTRWLATLLLPPAEYAPRRLFCPFAGVASEMIGAAQAGWDEVVGVEMMNDDEHPYVDIARARLAYWLAQPALIGEAR